MESNLPFLVASPVAVIGLSIFSCFVVRRYVYWKAAIIHYLLGVALLLYFFVRGMVNLSGEQPLFAHSSWLILPIGLTLCFKGLTECLQAEYFLTKNEKLVSQFEWTNRCFGYCCFLDLILAILYVGSLVLKSA
jgi:hypothetical protein